MTNIPAELRYSKDHEWVRVDGALARVGLTDFAQRQLGDIVFVELPKVGDSVTAGEPFGSVESVKAVSEIVGPVSGVIAEVDDELASSPEFINSDPYGEGWIVAVHYSDPTEFGELMTSLQYEEYLRTGADD